MKSKTKITFKPGDEVVWKAAIGQGAVVPAVLLGTNRKIKNRVNVEDANGKLFHVDPNDLIHFDNEKHKLIVKNFKDALNLVRKNIQLAHDIDYMPLYRMREYSNFKVDLHDLVEVLNYKAKSEYDEVTEYHEEDYDYEDEDDYDY